VSISIESAGPISAGVTLAGARSTSTNGTTTAVLAGESSGIGVAESCSFLSRQPQCAAGSTQISRGTRRSMPHQIAALSGVVTTVFIERVRMAGVI
jgi:hypothetical protein